MRLWPGCETDFRNRVKPHERFSTSGGRGRPAPHPGLLRNCSSGDSLLAMQTAQVDLVGVGLNATDTLIHLEKYPSRGAKVESARVEVLPGGQVASAVIA